MSLSLFVDILYPEKINQTVFFKQRLNNLFPKKYFSVYKFPKKNIVPNVSIWI
jgi:hypothetical protein